MNPKSIILVAGPNGSGKSSLSKHFSGNGAVIFDPDKERAILEDKYPGLPDENLYHALNATFQERIEVVLSTGLDFTIESNLREENIMETIHRFKSAGYETNLLFIALGSIADSKKRVAQRVKEGGHFVDDYSIEYNFKASKRTLVKIVAQFDKVLILESLTDTINPILRITNGKVATDLPETTWGNILQQEIVAALIFAP